ncbi:hypothetical protein [Nocardiopsis sp. CA-288880]|uniref:hypothetical protein n=1 Tax=Nocardiopsis sp. CA-288880 TaxID=3239995 RepID=UPI003D99F88D
MFTMRSATGDDTPGVASMITARCDWMEQRGSESWRENVDASTARPATAFAPIDQERPCSQD